MEASVDPAPAPSLCGDPDEVRTRAYNLWISEGCPDGRALEHWVAAERELRSGGTGTFSDTPQPAVGPA